MATWFSVPAAAREAGVPPRFRYWFGHSGKRYLFTRVECAALADLEDAVVLIARAGCIVWAGEATGEWPLAGAVEGDSRFEVYIHLLAPDADRREMAVRDLTPSHHCTDVAAAA